MLQHRDIDSVLIPRILRETPRWTTMAELEARADEAIVRLRASRSERAGDAGSWRKVAVKLDDWLRTDQPEYLDLPDFPAERKQKIVHALHRFNQGVLAYRRFFQVLLPMLHSVQSEHRRPVRILELASGSGEFSFALERLAAGAGIRVDVTGSDYFIEHVEAGNDKSAARGSQVNFIPLNAFDMSGIDPGSYDIVFIAQSIHHFSAGQVAMMVAQATRVASIGFIGIDGRRSADLFLIVPLPSLLLRSRDYLHDAMVTLRKFYTETELELIGRLAVPDGFVSVRPELPGYSVLMATT